MAGGNKKKKKAAVNPARGFATTSVVSKSKQEIAEQTINTEPSEISTPGDTSDQVDNTESRVKNDATARRVPELHELSPEQLEAQLELSDLQRFIEQYRPQAKKESSRQANKLQTEKRLLRSQSDDLFLKNWLPDDIILQILDYLATESDAQATSNEVVHPAGDDLLSKVWQLYLCLIELEVSSSRSKDAIAYILSRSAIADPNSSLWGLSPALDWLSLHCNEDELREYDHRAPQIAVKDDEDDGYCSEGSAPAVRTSGIQTPADTAPSSQNSSSDDVDVSDVESDLEPDQLVSVYLQTKARLLDLDPAAEAPQARRGKQQKNALQANPPVQTSAMRKLQQRLQKIESDILFDRDEAELQWSIERAERLHDQAERRRLQLQLEPSSGKKADLHTSIVNDGAERIGRELLEENGDAGDGNLLGGMFDALPGVQESNVLNGSSSDNHSASVTVRDFGKISGLSPKRILEEACKARDSRCKITFKLISPTTYASRQSVTMNWSQLQEATQLTLEFVRCRRKQMSLTVDMMTVATPDVAQSEGYVATAALFLLFSGNPRESKAHLRLPPAYRDLWDEFISEKQEAADADDRDIVKGLREIIDANPTLSTDDDEIVFNPAARRLNGNRSGASTPSQRSDAPFGLTNPPSSALQELWLQKTQTPFYQRMLQGRQKLPMYQFRDEALRTIEQHQITILCGETGCGKSTQLPAFIVEDQLSRGKECKIYCTEPRRISAVSLAQRVSEEMGERKGDVGTARSIVGYAIRLESHTTSATRLIYATVGIVLRMLENADGLRNTTHLVLDEVHERSIDTDFLLIVLRSLLLKRPDLKVVLMSATVDSQRFSTYFDGAPIINVPGRTFPVQAKFLEDAIELTGHTSEEVRKSEEDADEIEDAENISKGVATETLSRYSKRTRTTLANYDEYRIDYVLIIKLLEKIAYHTDYSRFSQAVLIFLPGIAEIRQLNDMLGGHPSFSQGWRIYPLHSTFSNEDQQAAFEVPPSGIRKIVLATNIAETGITIPDVTCVIDTGKHKEMRFDERRQMSRLIQSFIARANAKQRRGRAGRVQEGICFHLFTKHRHDTLMVDQQSPEMLRLSLQDLVMRVKICKLGDIEQTLSQALDPPSTRNIRRAIDALIEVNALTTSEDLTPLGQQLAKLPLDAQLGKLILFGSLYGCLDFALTIAATLSSKSPFLSPMHAKKQADTVRLGFRRGDSDLLTIYNAYCTWRKVCTTPGLSEFQFCNKNFLSSQNLGNIEDLKAQLLMSLADAGFVTLGSDERQALSKLRHNQRRRHFVALPEITCVANDNDEVSNSVTAWSFYPKVLTRDGKGWRNIANNQPLVLHPTSVNKTTLNPDVRILSFYSIMQTSSRFTNAQETSPVSDFALVLLAGEAVFHMYAGVIVIDGNRMKLRLRDWKSMMLLKTLRNRLKSCQARLLKSPGRELGPRYQRWMQLFAAIFAKRSSQ